MEIFPISLNDKTRWDEEVNPIFTDGPLPFDLFLFEKLQQVHIEFRFNGGRIATHESSQHIIKDFLAHRITSIK